MRHYTHPDLAEERAILASYWGLSTEEMQARRDTYIERTEALRPAIEAVEELWRAYGWATALVPFFNPARPAGDRYEYRSMYDVGLEEGRRIRCYRDDLERLLAQHRRELHRIAVEVGFPGAFAAHPERPVK